jgi:hypothetical protein
MEIWKDIKGYEGLYQVSNLGNVKSLKFKNNIILKGGIDSSGYKVVSLRDYNKKQSTKTVHRLVAIAFINNTQNKKCVNHINGIKTDNRIENLEWNTYNENMNHSFRTGLRKIGGNHPMAVKMIDTSNGKIFDTLKEAAEYCKLNPSNLIMMIKGYYKNKTTINYLNEK